MFVLPKGEINISRSEFYENEISIDEILQKRPMLPHRRRTENQDRIHQRTGQGIHRRFRIYYFEKEKVIIVDSDGDIEKQVGGMK